MDVSGEYQQRVKCDDLLLHEMEPVEVPFDLSSAYYPNNNTSSHDAEMYDYLNVLFQNSAKSKGSWNHSPVEAETFATDNSELPLLMKTTNIVSESTHEQVKESEAAKSSSVLQSELSLVRGRANLDTMFLPRYWKNGRKNLQCFPACPEFEDFYIMKTMKSRHTNVGVCRLPVLCTIEISPGGIHMADSYQYVKLFVLGQFESMEEGLLNTVKKPESCSIFHNESEFQKFKSNFYIAEKLKESSKCNLETRMIQHKYYFKPPAWKVLPALRKKRKASAKLPARNYPYCFAVYVYGQIPLNASIYFLDKCTSTPFELYSTRTIERVRSTAKSTKQAE